MKTVPGFFAEASLYREAAGLYSARSHSLADVGSIVPAAQCDADCYLAYGSWLLLCDWFGGGGRCRRRALSQYLDCVFEC
jgi:hypothetical protein